jgi:hypothetical protein
VCTRSAFFIQSTPQYFYLKSAFIGLFSRQITLF